MTALRAKNLFVLHSCLVLGVAGCSGEQSPGSQGSGGSAPVASGGATSGSGGTTSSGGVTARVGTSPTSGGMSGMTGVGGTAGTPGTGGAPTSGGAPPNGGTGAMGGGSSGGAPNGGGNGGMPPTGGSGGGAAGSPPQGACTIEAKAVLSEKIATVGIVEWSTDAQGVTGARIEFGPDTSYGLTAPVDLDEPSYRTLLLGMKPSKTYNYQIVVEANGTECRSQNYTIETGPRATGLPQIEVTTQQPDKLAPGFTITAQYQGTDKGGLAYILDQDGDFVWWFFVQGGTQFTRAVMSRDGKYMWAAKANVPNSGAKVYRIAMDGSGVEDLSTAFANQNHDLAVLPDESVAFIAYGNNGCDDIKLWSPDGNVRTIINSSQIASGGMCHCNALQYSPTDDTIVFSELNSDRYAKVKLDGEVVWVLGKGGDFSGDGASWDNQHGLDILGEDRLLIFNNGPGGTGSRSRAIEIALDLSGKTATRAWDYQGSTFNQIMGDVQRLPNGNTLVTYSAEGLMEEVDADMNLVQQIEFAIGGAVGYADKVPSLYPQRSSSD